MISRTGSWASSSVGVEQGQLVDVRGERRPHLDVGGTGLDQFDMGVRTAVHKPTSSLNAHDGAVVRPAGCKWLNYEGEAAIVIGRTARNIAPQDAGRHIAGYTIANDYGLHDFRDTDAGSMLRVKGSDTLRTLVNGVVVQDGSTDEMTWDMHYLVADIARTITLLPGDVLLSGTPANSRTVHPGDVVEVRVEGLGALRNHIVEGPTPIRSDVGAQPSRIRRGAVHRVRRRLGVPRDPGAAPSVTVTLRADSSS
ncbi:MAG TPA: fumarylacetoacetate hydrolase family protein [Kineosporiaceae bacterium]|nr:fumarylacetoacetate hydrolase family protein [Kineosporiaceae bacterium]